MAMATIHSVDLPNDDTPVPIAAEMYAQLGFKVIPLWGISPVPPHRCTCSNADCEERSWGKHPVPPKWQTRATSNLDDVRELFRGHRGNIGIMLGQEFVVIDVDGDAGQASLDGLGKLPPTLASRSGNGEHLVYRYAAHQDPARISNRRVLPGIDVKTRNGQMVVAPSLHRTLRRYEWTNRALPAVLPDSLYEKIVRAEPNVRSLPSASAPAIASSLAHRARCYLDAIPPAVSGARGHDKAFAAARALVSFMQKGLPEADAWSILLDYNTRCEPPWSERELQHKWTEAQHRATTIPEIPDRPPPAPAQVVNIHEPRSTPPGGGAPPAALDWRARMLWEVSAKGANRPARHAENAIVVLRYHPAWAGRLRFDTHGQLVTVSDPPWHESDDHEASGGERAWTDADTVRLSAWLRREVSPLDLSTADCDRAVVVAAEASPYHPVRDYFDSLQWDQSPRLSTAPARYLGTQQTDYTALVLRWWMIAAVARTYQPGCKVDNVLILEGPQGIRKSSALRVLAGPRWFSDTPIDLQHKDAFQALPGKLVVELAELESLRKADANRAKTFFSSAVDDYRPPYGRRNVKVPRGCVFAGTVNHASYLQDPTGARRYWPLACTRIDLAAISEDRDQLWAEAVHWYRAGMKWHAETPEEIALCASEQAPRDEGDEWETIIGAHLHTRAPATISVGELLEDVLGVKPGDWTRADQMRVSSILQRLGYERFRETSLPRVWRYRVRTDPKH